MAVYNSTRSRERAERLVKLRDYLYANASPTHAVKMADIIEYLESESYEVTIKTVYSDIKTLKYFFKVDTKYDGRQRGYLLLNPPFEPYELRSIVNSIQAAKFLTQQEADRLTDKVSELADKDTRLSLKRKICVYNRTRAINEEAMIALETIYEAIAKDQKIRYKYFYYTSDSHNPKYYSNRNGNRDIIASPYEVFWNGEEFLVSVTQVIDRKEKITTLHLEHMEQVEIHPDKREGKELVKNQSKTKLHSRRRKLPSQVKLKAWKAFATFIIDKFGNDVIMMIPQDDDNFTAIVNTRPTPELYMWTLIFHPRIEITFPEDAESKLRQYFLEISEGKQPFPPFGRLN